MNKHEQQHTMWLKEQLAGIMKKLEETLAASEKEKVKCSDADQCDTLRVLILTVKHVFVCQISNFRELRVSMSKNMLDMVISREELRQQTLHSTICGAHLQLQVGPL